MYLTYILLFATVITALFYKNQRALYVTIVTTNCVALYQGVLHPIGFCTLCTFGLVVLWYFYPKNNNIFVRAISFILLVVFATLFSYHLMPGFSSLLALNQVQLSTLSSPFSMYLNFDKVMAGVMLYVLSPLYSAERKIDASSLQYTIFALIACIAVIVGVAYTSGYIKLDAKLPSILPIFVLNNFFFVCFAEEVIFRGFLQNNIQKLLGKYGAKFPYLAIILSALVFGICHYKGGLIYVAVATISGGFYGYTYHRTNRILCAMIVHCGLNLFHLLLFTYPYAIA